MTGNLVLVEGESDSWVGWLHDLPVLGIPGASMNKTLLAEHVRGIRNVFIVQEPDPTGEKFVHAVGERLATFGFEGDVRVLDLRADLADYHLKHGDDFKNRLIEATKVAPLVDDTADADADTGTSATVESIGPPTSVGEIFAAIGLDDLGEHATSDEMLVMLQRLKEVVKGVDAIVVTLAREAAIERFGETGLKSPARAVDAALGNVAVDEVPRNLQGKAIVFEDPEPWQHLVDGAELLAEMSGAVSRFVFMTSVAKSRAMALWELFSHVLDAFGISPNLLLTSPQKRCGKTTLLDVIMAFVPRPLGTSNLTAATLFRVVDAVQPTLCIDEADTFMGSRDELTGIINSGHRRTAAFVMRCVGDNQEVRTFGTWAPKVLAQIGKPTDTTLDRSIEIRMQRRTPAEEVENLRVDRIRDEMKPLCRKAARWAADHMEELQRADPDMPAELHDRAADNWRPLVAIADAVGGAWPEWARDDAAKELSGSTLEDDETLPVLLLSDLRDLFGDVDQLSSGQIVESLAELEDRPWAEWGRQRKPITPHGIARLLKPFGIKPRQIKITGENLRGYEHADFENAWARYLPGDVAVEHPPLPECYPATIQAHAGFQGKPECYRPGKGSRGATG